MFTALYRALGVKNVTLQKKTTAPVEKPCTASTVQPGPGGPGGPGWTRQDQGTRKIRRDQEDQGTRRIRLDQEDQAGPGGPGDHMEEPTGRGTKALAAAAPLQV